MIGCLNIVSRKIKTKYATKQSKTASNVTSQSELPTETEAMDLNKEQLKRGAPPKQTQKVETLGTSSLSCTSQKFFIFLNL